METASERRKRKLAWLVSNHGGLAAIAEKAGLSAAALDQVLKGVRPAAMKQPKGLGNKAARAIEDAFKLGTGWFDTPDAETAAAVSFGDLNAFEAQLVTFFRQLDASVQHEVLTSLNSMLPKSKASKHDPFPHRRTVRGTSIFGELPNTAGNKVSISTEQDDQRNERLPPKAG
jgi:hypothetical protein